MRWIACLGLLALAWPSPAAAEPSVVAVFDLEVSRLKLDRGAREGLSELLFNKVAGLPGYTVIPRSDLKSRLNTQKKESYRACYDQSCQIEIGKELAAQKLLSTKVIKLGAECTVSMVLYDLRTAATEAATDATGGCKAGALAKSLAAAVTQLGTKTAPTMAAASGVMPGTVTVGVEDPVHCPLAGTRRLGDPYPEGQSVSCIDGKGQVQGKMIAWHNTGKISMEAEFKDSQMTGLQTLYYPNGSILQKGENLKGRRNGAWVGYFDDGTKMEEGSYSLGAKTGKWSNYRPDGKLDEVCDYVADQREGECTSYHADGVTVHEHGLWRGNKREGVLMSFRPDGSKERETNYRANLRDGEDVEYGRDGEEKRRVVYEKGQRR